MTRSSNPRAGRRGAAAAEFAIMAVPLFLMIVGMTESGGALGGKQLCPAPARRACRFAVGNTHTHATVDAEARLVLTDNNLGATAKTNATINIYRAAAPSAGWSQTTATSLTTIGSSS